MGPTYMYISEVEGKPGGATLNREIGFVSSSFSCCAWRACEWAGRSCQCVRGAECSSSRWPRLWEVVLLFAASLRTSGRGVDLGFKAKWIQIWTAPLSLRVFRVSFTNVLHGTRVYGLGFMANPLKTNVVHIMQEESY